MFDNMSEFVAATLREDAAAWAKQRARVRAMEREGRTGRQRRHRRRVAIAQALVMVAIRLDPSVVTISASRQIGAAAGETHHGLSARV